MSGIFSSSRDFVKMILRGVNKDFLHFFINMGWILSGPLDFVSLTLSIAFSNFLSVISIEWSGSMKRTILEIG